MLKILVKYGLISVLIWMLNMYIIRLIGSNHIRFKHWTNYDSKFRTKSSKKSRTNKPIIIGLFTNELAPWVVYGGVATWIDSYISMFKKNKQIIIVPIFLAYNDSLPEECFKKYPNLRIIENSTDIYKSFKDIDICINNLWISLDTILEIKQLFPELPIISVCHSLIRMELITNMGSQYTENFNDQEKLFENSDYVVLISKAEEKYYKKFGYDRFKAKTAVIYNTYTPKYDDTRYNVNYDLNDVGYIGRHVPRKRPELPLKAVEYLGNKDVTVYNMGVDYDKYDNAYWRKLEKEYTDMLEVIPFSTNNQIKADFFSKVGIISIPGIYEPFGYTICEALDRGFPAIVQNIDGPKEIVEGFEEYVYLYQVDMDDYEQDIVNFSIALEQLWGTEPGLRKKNAEMARKALDRFRPEEIYKDWVELFNKII